MYVRYPSADVSPKRPESPSPYNRSVNDGDRESSFSPDYSQVDKHPTKLFLSRDDFSSKLQREDQTRTKQAFLMAANKPMINKATRYLSSKLSLI